MLHAISVRSTRVSKSQGLKLMCFRMERSVVVYALSGCNDGGAFWNKCAVRECEVFQRLVQYSRIVNKFSDQCLVCQMDVEGHAYINTSYTLTLFEEAIYFSRLSPVQLLVIPPCER